MEISQLVQNIKFDNVKDGLVVASIDDKVKYLSQWKRYKFPRGQKDMPKRLLDIIELNGNMVWKYSNIWYKDCIYYKGDVDTTSDWLFITNGGGYYKVGTKYCVWETRTWIDRERFPYDKEYVNLGKNRLFLGCERGPMSKVFDELSASYFGLDFLGK